MSVQISTGSVVVRLSPLEAKFRGGVPESLEGTHPASVASDGHVAVLSFANDSDRALWVSRMSEHGLDSDVVTVDRAEELATEWLRIENSGEQVIVSLKGAEAAPLATTEHRPFQRHEILSRSASGLHFVRERKSGILRQLTEEELLDFNDPPPCDQCGEQFGCDHLNCAGERLMSDAEVEQDVPAEWKRFALDKGVSHRDLERLRALQLRDGAYHVAPDATSDMRLLELLLLLNGEEE
jgi:hypothetical protein